MGRQRINLSAVDFSPADADYGSFRPVPGASMFWPQYAPFSRYNWKKRASGGDDFCDHCSSCHATPAVRAAFMISQIYRVRVADAFHQAPFIIRALGSHLMPGGDGSADISAEPDAGSAGQ